MIATVRGYTHSILTGLLMTVLLASLMCSTAIRIGHADVPIAASADEIQPLSAGDTAPRFVVRTVDGDNFDFDPQALQRPAVLITFRGGWCPYCNIHLSDLRHVIPEISAMGVDVLFLSGDRPEALYDGLQMGTQDEIDGLEYRILSDANASASIALGIAFQADPAYVARLIERGKDIGDSSIEREGVLPVPAVFAIGADGTIAFAHTNADYKVRLPAEQLRDVASELVAR